MSGMDLIGFIVVFILATYLGATLIGRVPPTLHTPLMSGANAVSGITVVGAMAIAIGIAAKGQNVAHLVALAFAVAASANFPCVLLTLYWKRCNTGGIVLGMVVGTLTAISLVLVSPNMTYPKALKAAAQKVVDGAQARSATATADLADVADDAAKAKAGRAIAAIEKDVAGAKATLERYLNRVEARRN